jgi:CheY-like chemotaxis protein/tetratricopeptide (TPR) repeat protein
MAVRTPDSKEMQMRKTVLIADDDRFTRELLEFIVTGFGYKVILCEDGKEALKILEKEMIHLVLMDILMPRMDGVETLERMKKIEHARSIPVVLMTGIYKGGDLARQLKLTEEKENIIFKPFTIEKIQHVLSRYLGEDKSVQLVFPESVKSRPGFNKRIRVMENHSAPAQQDKQIQWFLPTKGTLAKSKLCQIFHYLLNVGGSWCASIDSPDARGYFCIENNNLVGYWSQTPADMNEINLKEKVLQMGWHWMKKVSGRIHPWKDGVRATPFTFFMYRACTSSRGTYQLDKIPSENLRMPECKKIQPLELNAIINECISGPFSQDIIDLNLPIKETTAKMSEYCRQQPQGVKWTPLQEKVATHISDEMNLLDLAEKSGLSSYDLLQAVFGLWLMGAVEIKRVIAKPSTQPIKIDAFASSENQAEHHIVHGASQKTLENNIHKLFDYASHGRYFEFLGLSRKSMGSDILHECSIAKTKIAQWSEKDALSHESMLQLKCLDLAIEEARSFFRKAKNVSRYKEIIEEQDPEIRKKLADQEFDFGLMHFGEGNLPKGIAEFKLSLLLDPHNEDAYSQVLEAMSQNPEYLFMEYEISSRAVKAFPMNPEFRLHFGRSLKNLDRPEEAVEELKKVLAIDPGNYEATQYLLELPGMENNLGFDVD